MDSQFDMQRRALDDIMVACFVTIHIRIYNPGSGNVAQNVNGLKYIQILNF